MADAEDEAGKEAMEAEADAEQVGDTDKPPIGSPREAVVADTGADAAEDANGTAHMAAGKDLLVTTARPATRTYPSATITTTTAGVVAGT